KDHREGMKMNTLTDQSRVNDVILDDSQNSEKQQHQESIEWTSMKHRENAGHDRDRDWSNKWYELKETCQHTHHQPARQSQHSESQCTDHADKQTRRQLGTNVSSQCAVDVLEKLVTAPAPATTRKHQQRRTPEALGILQKKESQNRNENQPRQIDQISQRGVEEQFNCFKNCFANTWHRVI